jgi:hypothetical protein
MAAQHWLGYRISHDLDCKKKIDVLNLGIHWLLYHGGIGIAKPEKGGLATTAATTHSHCRRCNRK